MFAGPNGSGKSTFKSYLPAALLGVYLNPDDIQQDIRQRGALDISAYGVDTSASEVRAFFTASPLLNREGMADEVAKLLFLDASIDFADVAVDSYFASTAADFLRQQLVKQKQTFTFETVMSHVSKVQILMKAQAQGYRTYLYYVATEDSAINVSRVAVRVAMGGHTVPEDKIVSRYHRSLNLLMAATRETNRAYFFDNSTDNAGGQLAWLAEITDGRNLELKTEPVSTWFKRAVLDKIG